MVEPVRLGVLGCGTISTLYLDRLTALETVEVAACADLRKDRAAARAQQYRVPEVCTPEELVAHPDIELVLNLTIPAAHAPLGLAALQAGKSHYTEKPLALTRAEGQQLLDLAHARQLRLGAAPDTFLGAGLQTCRALIDAGAIGEPVAAAGFFMSAGAEVWHPDPAFLYQRGGGPVFDVGVYYLTALVSLLGPARRVCGSARISTPERVIKSPPLFGTKIKVEVPTHVSAVLDLASGPVVTLIASNDVPATQLPPLEIYGSEATLALPDPNGFGGPVRLRGVGDPEWRDVPLVSGFAEQARGIGLAELVLATRAGVPHRASGELALHVLDIMESIHEASATNRAVRLTTTCQRPATLPAGWDATAAWQGQ